MLRHENYDMRTVVSDPQTQHHLLEASELQRTAAPTTELPKIQADSSSPNGPASEDTEMQRKLQEVREEYEGRIASLEKQQQDALKDLVRLNSDNGYGIYARNITACIVLAQSS